MALAYTTLLAGGPASARLYEHEAYCDGRYNKSGTPYLETAADRNMPLKLGRTPLLTRTYNYTAGWKVRIGFMNSQAHVLCFDPPFAPNAPTTWHWNVLQANGGTQSWKRIVYDRLTVTDAKIADQISYFGGGEWYVRNDGAVAYPWGFQCLRLETKEAFGIAYRQHLQQTRPKPQPLPAF